GNPQVLDDPVDVLPRGLFHFARQAEPRQAIEDLPGPVSELDEIPAAAAIPRLELEVAADHLVATRTYAGQPVERFAEGRRCRTGTAPGRARSAGSGLFAARRRPVHGSSHIS